MKFLRLVLRNALRKPVRTALTGLAIAVSVFIFTALVAIDRGVKEMVQKSGGDLTITVFEKYKACPPYSSLPLHYRDKIASVPGVRAVMPVRFLLSNCQTTTDLVAVYGIEAGLLREFRKIELPEDQYRAFVGERGAAIVGEAVARKYRWSVGDQVTLKELRGISFAVRGIFRSPGANLESVILVDRGYLEFAVQQVGKETMFLVKVDSPQEIDRVSHEIDALFANSQTQTQSGPEKSFIAGSIEDFKSMVEFSQVVAYVALALLLAAVANSVSMSVRDRLREMAILKILGFRRARVVRLIMTEVFVVGAVSAALGALGAALLLRLKDLSISVEGYTIFPHLGASVILLGIGLGTALGALGALFPAVLGAKRPIVLALREVD